MSRKILRTTCNRDCPDSCAVLATVEDGRIVKQHGDAEHGVTRGFLCLRGNRYLDRFYSDQRILHPMRRTRGGGWERLGWDDALDLCAARLSACREEAGARAVAVIKYSGIKGQVARLAHRIFWAHFGGATHAEGGTSTEAAVAAQHMDFGSDGTHPAEDLAHSRAVVVWGKNIDVTRPHTMRFVTDARRAGAVMHVIDPVRCATARKADRHHQIRPGSDGWLALGVGKLLLQGGAVDAGFMERSIDGYDAYQRLVLGVDLGRVYAETALPVGAVEELAELYATVRPAATFIGLGPAYWEDAGTTVRLIDALAMVSGNIGIPGGGAQTDSDWGYAGLDLSLPEGTPRPRQRRVMMPRLGSDLAAATDPPPRVGWITGANPAATCPDTAAVDGALAGLEFLVVVDQFLTASCAHADLFLPCATYLEHDDLVTAYGHTWIGASQAVVEPLGEVRSDLEIYQGLAARLGFGAALAGPAERWADSILGELAREHGITFSRLRQGAVNNPLAPEVPFAGGQFPTASGKGRIIGELPAAHPRSAALDEGELHLVATKTLKMVNAQINPGDVPDGPLVRLHPEAAAARGLEEGAMVRVRSGAGQVEAVLRLDETLRADMLLLNPAAWRGDLQGVNQLREAKLTDLGKAAAMHGTAVRVELA